MNNLISRRIEEHQSIANSSERMLKARYSIEFIIIYYAIAFYSETKARSLAKKKIVHLIQFEFRKKSPLISSWIKLLQYSLSLLGRELPSFNSDSGIKIQRIANKFLPPESRKDLVESPSLETVLRAYSVIRNKGIAHASNISTQTIETLVENQFDKFPEELACYLEGFDASKLLLSHEISKTLKSTNYFTFIDYSKERKNTVEIGLNELKRDEDELYSNQFYFFFQKEKRLIHGLPFLAREDGKSYHFVSVDKNGVPSYAELFTSEIICRENYNSIFLDLIKDDLNLLTPEIKFQLTRENGVFHNIPKPPYSEYIGRVEVRKKILKTLKHRRLFLITISGIGGVGKSALVIKSVRDLIENGDDYFNYILWVSAKKTFLKTDGIEVKDQSFQNLNQLLDLILKVTGFSEYTSLTFREKRKAALEILSMDQFLLMVDNFETIDNPKEFLDFFEEVGDYCPDTKVLLTTRHQLGSSEKVIDLREFSLDDFRDFAKYLHNEKFKIDSEIRRSDVDRLYKLTGGLPLATEFFIGQCTDENNLRDIVYKIDRGNITKESILEFSFTESFEKLSNEEKRVLFAIALLEEANIDSICFISDLVELDVEDCLSNLKKYSFINENTEEDYIIFSLLPLTKSFLINELNKNEALSKKINVRYKEYEYLLSIESDLQGVSFSGGNISRNNLALMFAKAAYASAKERDNDKAEDYFKKALEYDSKQGAVWYHKAIAERDFANNVSKEYFENAIRYSESEKDKIIMRYEYATALYIDNEYNECISQMNLVLESKEKNVYFEKNAYHIIGKSHYSIGKNYFFEKQQNFMSDAYAKSKEAFVKSLYDDVGTYVNKNHNTIGYYFLGRICLYLKRYEDAHIYINNGLDLQPINYKLKKLQEEVDRAQAKRVWFR